MVGIPDTNPASTPCMPTQKLSKWQAASTISSPRSAESRGRWGPTTRRCLLASALRWPPPAMDPSRPSSPPHQPRRLDGIWMREARDRTMTYSSSGRDTSTSRSCPWVEPPLSNAHTQTYTPLRAQPACWNSTTLTTKSQVRAAAAHASRSPRYTTAHVAEQLNVVVAHI